MDFCVLGPIEVRENDRVVPLRRQKQRALLALLVLHVGEVVSSDRLLDALWGEEPPRTAKGSLHNCVSQLRRALGPETLLTRAPGYVLDIDPERIDLVRFERLVTEALQIDDGGRAAKLRAALALWRGPPLADLSFEPFAQATIQQLEERRLAVLEDRIEADLGTGRHGDLVGELESLVAEHPLRERLRGQLMLALYGSGRQAEALAAYQEGRRVLVEELGIEPSPSLRELEQAILRQDPALAPAAEEEREAALPEPEPLRKTATVLFIELAATPQGSADIDQETLHRATLRGSHELRAAVEYHGGAVERLTGDELMAVFGVPIAHEDDAARAARAALQVRRALANASEPLEGESGVRIEPRTAIVTGMVTAEPALTGAIVGLGSRLAETAGPGEILVDGPTLERAENELRTTPLEPREVRGRQEPIPVHRLLDVVEKAPAPVETSTPLIGRKSEIAALLAVLNRTTTESRCVVACLFGDAGIGKSRLAAEFASLARDEAAIFVGRCISYGEGATYLPVLEIVAQAAGEHPSERIFQILEGEEDAELIAQRIADLVEGAGGESSTGEVFWAIRRLLEGLARKKPLILVFEDLHWAEPTLLDLVEYLGQWSSEVPLLLLGLARPELLERRPAWAVETTAVHIGPLAESDAVELVEVVGRDALAEGARVRVAELAEGNPLFAEQLVALALEEGSSSLDTVPPSLEALLASRLDRLDVAERAVLQRAAVVGREFWHGAILHLSPPLEVPSVGRRLLEVVRKGLIEPAVSAFAREDAFRFHHVLIRDVAYNSIPDAVRAELHERAADWLDVQPGAQDELVGYHLEQAYECRLESGSPDRRAQRLAADAGDRLAAAGLRAAKSGDTAAAANLLTRSTVLLPPDEATRRDLLAELGLTVWSAGDIDEAAAVLGRALETATAAHDRRAELRTRLELANLRLFRSPEGGADDFLSLAAEAIPVLEELGDDRALGRCWYSLAFVHGGLHCRYRESVEAAERALEHFRNSTWSVAPCLQELSAGLYYGPTPVPDAIRRCNAFREDADRGGEANIMAFLAGLEAMAGHFGNAQDLVSRARGIYDELGWVVYGATNCTTVAADVELLAGRHAEAERLLTESCASLEEWGEQAHRATQASQLGEAVYRQGRYDDASHWAGVAKACAATDDASAQFSWRALQAKVLAREGESEEADMLARDAAALAAKTDALTQHGNVLLDLGEVLRLDGRATEAAAAIEDAVRLFEKKQNVAASQKARESLSELATA
ncbi:MAG: AAA family ATPase [Actinomycetota bacterium]|nr:AAA family ATPase [Actinomycetota bacterium]